MIRATFFDLDDTLFDRRETFRRYAVDLVARRPEALDGVKPDDALTLLLAGRDRREFARRAASRFPALGTVADIARDIDERLATFVRPDPGVEEVLAGLAVRKRLAVVTNGSGRGQRAKLAGLGLGDRTPRAFISGERGAVKPDPALFLAALAWAECRPDEALFVGDDPACDVAGAAGVGMATCWVARGRSYPSDQPAPTMTIDRVADLEGAVP